MTIKIAMKVSAVRQVSVTLRRTVTGHAFKRTARREGQPKKWAAAKIREDFRRRACAQDPFRASYADRIHAR